MTYIIYKQSTLASLHTTGNLGEAKSELVGRWDGGITNVQGKDDGSLPWGQRRGSAEQWIASKSGVRCGGG